MVKQKIENTDFSLLTKKSAFVDVYELVDPESLLSPQELAEIYSQNIEADENFTDLMPSVVIKVAKNNIDFDSQILPGYMIAKDKLGGLFVAMILENVTLSIRTETRSITRKTFDKVIVREKAPSIEKFLEAARNKFSTTVSPQTSQVKTYTNLMKQRHYNRFLAL